MIARPVRPNEPNKRRATHQAPAAWDSGEQQKFHHLQNARASQARAAVSHATSSWANFFSTEFEKGDALCYCCRILNQTNQTNQRIATCQSCTDWSSLARSSWSAPCQCQLTAKALRAPRSSTSEDWKTKTQENLHKNKNKKTQQKRLSKKLITSHQVTASACSFVEVKLRKVNKASSHLALIFVFSMIFYAWFTMIPWFPCCTAASCMYPVRVTGRCLVPCSKASIWAA